MLQTRSLLLSQLESPRERNELLICKRLQVEISLQDTSIEIVPEYSSRTNQKESQTKVLILTNWAV